MPMFKGSRVIRRLITYSARFIGGVPIVNVRQELCHFVNCRLLTTAMGHATSEKDPLTQSATISRRFLNNKVISRARDSATFFHYVISGLLQTCLSGQTTHSARNGTFRRNELTNPIQLLKLVIPIVTRGRYHRTLPRRMKRQARNTRVFNFCHLWFPRSLFSVLSGCSGPVSASSVYFSQRGSS